MPQLQHWSPALRPIAPAWSAQESLLPEKRPRSTDTDEPDTEPASKQMHAIAPDHASLVQPNTGSQRQKRKDQNRAAQRAFRERKERYVKELEAKIQDMEKSHNETVGRLETENEQLRYSIKALETQVHALKEGGTSISYDMATPTETTTAASTVASAQLGETNLDMLEPASTILAPAQTVSSSIYADEAVRPPSPWPWHSSSAMACIRDKDGVSVCEHRREELSPMLFQQLFSDPLFDMSDLFQPNAFLPSSQTEKDTELDKLATNLSQNLGSTSTDPLSTDDALISQIWDPIPPQSSDFENHELLS